MQTGTVDSSSMYTVYSVYSMYNVHSVYIVYSVLCIRHEKSEKASASSFLGSKISAKVRDSRPFPIYDKRSYLRFLSLNIINLD